MLSRYALLLSAAGLALAAQTGPDVTSTAKDRTGLGITIYHNNLAMIRESRRIQLPSGRVQVAFQHLAASIKPKSAWMEFGGAPLVPHVVERNFEFNLLSPASAVNHSLGLPAAYRDLIDGSIQWGTLASIPLRQTIWAPGQTLLQRIRKTGPALAKADPGTLIETSRGFQDIPGDQVIFRGVPAVLRTSPTLLASVESVWSSQSTIELAYTAEGFTWQGDYVATLSASGKTLDLNAWVTLTNSSGTDFQDATLQLVAGEPNQVWDPSEKSQNTSDQTTVEVVGSSVAGPPTFEEERLSEFYLFTLDRPTTLKNQQTKQVALFIAKSIPARQMFIAQPPDSLFANGANSYFGGTTFNPQGATDPIWVDPYQFTWQAFEWKHKQQEIHPPVRIQAQIQNVAGSGLGRPLPQGTVQVFYRPHRGQEVWLSQSEIQETPSGEYLKFDTGEAANLSVHRKATDIRLQSQDKDKRVYEIAFEVRINNQRRETTTVQVCEPIFAGWEILESSHPHTRVGTDAVDFKVMVRPGKEVILRYRVRTDPTTFSFEQQTRN